MAVFFVCGLSGSWYRKGCTRDRRLDGNVQKEELCRNVWKIMEKLDIINLIICSYPLIFKVKIILKLSIVEY